MTPLALRDHIQEILDFISHDIEAHQTDADQEKKSQGKKRPECCRIFESLIRAEDAKNPMITSNLGLGLYITKEIIEAHKGTIRVTSTEKEGTDFTVRLPRSLKHSELPAKPDAHLSLVAI